MQVDAEPRYIPAARWRIFTRLYDPIIAVTMREKRFRAQMLERVEADLPSGGTAVDVGCGTGTFALALAARRADAQVVGVDGDAEILRLARAKPGAGAVEWQEGLAQELPLPDDSADVVTISLVLHHLLPEDKRAALAEMKRILKPGGHLHVADWGRPADPLMSALFFVVQAIDGFDRTADHRAGRLPAFIAEAGFAPVERYGGLRTGFGSVELFDGGAGEGMRAPRLRGLLPAVLLLLGAVALVAGLFTVATGTGGMPGESSATPNVESELRFYAVFWSAFGVLALLAARSPERQTSLVRGLALFLFLGGVARGLTWLASAQPDTQFLVLMGLELALPVFILWAQARISRPARST